MATRRRSQLTRWVFILVLAFSAPAVQDALTDFTAWVTGQTCCADDCDDTGSPCTQQCAHCPCGSLRAATLQSAGAEAVVVVGSEAVAVGTLVSPRSTPLDPPFRPPVS